MAKKKVFIPPSLDEQNAHALRDAREMKLNDPTIFYEVGQEVKYGGFDKAKVLEVIDGGKIYKLHCEKYENKHGVDTVEVNIRYGVWHDIFNTFELTNVIEPFSKRNELRIDFYNADINSLLHKYYFFGVNMNPEYQRDLVWTEEQEHSLLDSIYNHVEIGKFAFNHCGYTTDTTYEIIDGKQRLNTLIKFTEGRIKYRGKTIFEMHSADRYFFENYPVSFGEIRNATKEQIYRYFIKLNTGGVSVSKEHLANVAKLLDNEIKA